MSHAVQLILDVQDTPFSTQFSALFPPSPNALWSELMRALGALEEAMHEGTFVPPNETTPEAYMCGVVLPAVKDHWNTPTEERVGLHRWQTLSYPSTLWTLVCVLDLHLEQAHMDIMAQANLSHVKSLELSGEPKEIWHALETLNTPCLSTLTLNMLKQGDVMPSNGWTDFNALHTLHLVIQAPNASEHPIQLDLRAVPLANLSIRSCSASPKSYELKLPTTLHHVVLHGLALDHSELRKLVKSVESVHTLELSKSTLDDTSIDVLTSAPLLHLHTLSLCDNAITSHGARTLATSRALPALQTLHMEDNIGPALPLTHWRKALPESKNALFGDIRALLHKSPSAARWGELLETLDEWPDREDLRHDIVPYAMTLLRAWPDALRYAPEDWQRRLKSNQHTEVLKLVRALDITEDFWASSPDYRQLGCFDTLTHLVLDIDSSGGALEFLHAHRVIHALTHLTVRGSLEEEYVTPPSHENQTALPPLEQLTFEHCTSQAGMQRLLSSLGDEIHTVRAGQGTVIELELMRTIMTPSVLPKIHTLEVHKSDLKDDAFEVLRRDAPSTLRHLKLNHVSLMDDDVHRLLGAPWLTALRSIELLGTELEDPEIIRPLLTNPACHKLEHIACASYALIHEDWLTLRDATPSSDGAAKWMRAQGMLD